MTHPLTPREKVARALSPKCWEFYDRHVDDPRMAAEIKHEVAPSLDATDAILTALASGSGDHAELARSAEEALLPIPEKRRKSWFNRQNRFRDAANPATVLALLAENAALRERLETARIARAAHNRQYEELRAGRIHLVEQKEGAEDALFDALTRATEAERKLAEADRAARQIVELKIPPGNDPEQRLKLLSLLAKAQVIARTFLSKEAERG